MTLALAAGPMVTAATDLGSQFATAAFSGSMLLAIPVAFVAGLVSFASPCVLPLVPGYLGYLGGMSGAALGQVGLVPRARTAAAVGRGRLLAGVGLFVAGFTVVFVTVGALAGSVGGILTRWQDPLTRTLGVVVLLMGLAFLGYVPFLQREARLRMKPAAGLWGAPLLGFTFGLGWAPCMGPTLAAVLALSLDGGSAVRGATLAVAYCLGLGLPFLVLAVGLGTSGTALAVLRRHRQAISRVGGGMLVIIGLAMVTGLWSRWTQLMQGLVASFQTVV